MPQTLFEKIWQDHLIADLGDGSCLLHVDRVFLHERTGSIALRGMAEKQRRVRNPGQVFCTMDHIVDTFPGRGDETTLPGGRQFITLTRQEARRNGITLFDINDPRQGISHVISAEQGIALPGLTVVCPDSHTCTLGALGALAWGIGSSDCEHALATETLRVVKPRQMGVYLGGSLFPGVTAKDVMLHLIGTYSVSGGSGHALEFHGPGIRQLPMEARMTLCNMAVEFSAFTGLVAPDDLTREYIAGRPYAPAGVDWDAALNHWSKLNTDVGASYDKELYLDLSQVEPSVTWGTSPQHVIGISSVIPDPSEEPDTTVRQGMQRALDYMGLNAGAAIASVPVDAAFIGSCTNSRLSDLRAAAAVLKGNRIAGGVKAICVPGSGQVKRAAEQEGLHEIFQDAGFEWREAGCSMCFYAGGEGFSAGERVITSTNRNFEGRQGPGVRSHLASPATVAASALTGRITDARTICPDSPAIMASPGEKFGLGVHA